MIEFKERIAEKLVPVLDEWGEFAIGLLRKAIQDNKLVRSGAGLRSLEYEVVKGGSFEIAGLLLGFNDYMRVQGMKETRHTKFPNIDVLEQYVRDYYFAKYGKAERYQRTLELRGYDAAVQELTWALANSIRYPVKKKKRRLFFAKTFYYRFGGESRNLLRTKVAEALTESDLLNLEKLAKESLNIQMNL